MNPKKYLIQKVKGHKNLLKLALKAYSIKYPPPYCQPNMEFQFDAWVGISSLHCWNGRQIGEDNAGPYPYREISGNQYETCPFTDSRAGLPMNVTNLRLVMPFAGEVYQLITSFRNMYIKKRQLNNHAFNLVQAYLFAKFALSLPSYLIRRKHNPLHDGNLQPVETAFYMVGTAPYLLVRQLMVRGDSTPLDPKMLSGQELYELADVSGVLISIRRKACPASSKLICELFDVIMNGSYKEPIYSPSVSRVLNEIGDWDNFFDYTLAASRLELLVKLNQAIIAQSLLNLRSEGGFAQEVDNNLLERVLQCTLSLSHAKIENEKDAHYIVENIIDILYALLLDHGKEKTLRELHCNHCWKPEDVVNMRFSYSDIQLIHQRHEILKEECRRELQVIHDTLGQTDWPSFNDEDYNKRIGGEELQTLLAKL